MTPLTAAKLGGGAAAAAGIPASIYFAHNYMTSLYEVENKVINEDVSFTVTSNDGTNVIKVNTTSSSTGTTWNETEGYYWECTISGATNLSIDASSKLSITSSDQEDTKKSKRNNKFSLVSLCAKDRKEFTDKKVKAAFTFPTDITSNWESYLFGTATTEEKPAPAA